LNDLVGIPLTHAETHVRKALSKTLCDGHQNIARVDVSRRHAQSSPVRIGMFRSCTADILDIAENAARDLNNGTPRFSKRRNPVAPADQQFSLQFLLQLTNLARHAGLRSVQRFSRLGDIELVVGDPAQVA
jgi:hypothetical protein